MHVYICVYIYYIRLYSSVLYCRGSNKIGGGLGKLLKSQKRTKFHKFHIQMDISNRNIRFHLRIEKNLENP